MSLARINALCLGSALILFACVGCAGNNVKASEDSKWAIDLTACKIEAPGDEAFAQLVAGIAVDHLIGKVKSAISNAAKDKHVKASPTARTYSIAKFTTACPDGSTRSQCSAYEARNCFAIGYGSASGTNNTGWLSDQFSASATLAKADADLLGFVGRPQFLARIGWKASEDRSAIRPVLRYLYYSTAMNRGRRSEAVAIAASGQLPGAEKPFIGFELRIPALSPDPDRLRGPDDLEIDQKTLLWAPIPDFWIKNFAVPDGPSNALPTNVSSTIVFTKKGNKFFAVLDELLNDSAQSAIASELKTELKGKDSKTLLDTYSSTWIAYLSAFAKLEKAQLDWCGNQSQAALEAARTAAQAAADRAYEKYVEAAGDAGIADLEPRQQATACA